MAWISINFESKALGMPVMTNVLMPQGRGGYKTLYLLHGAGGDYASWLLKSRLCGKQYFPEHLAGGNGSLHAHRVATKPRACA